MASLLEDMAPGAVMRMIQGRTMRGLDPTPAQAKWLAEQRPRLEQNGRDVADMFTPFPAIGEAVHDPSLANVTNAGVKTAGLLGKPLAALGILGAGFGTAAAKDAGLFDTSANAQTASQSRARAAEAAAKAKAEADILKAKTEAERQAAITRQQEADAASKRSAAEAGQGEYNRAVMKAEDTLKSYDDKRVKKFSETEIGKVYDKAGIAAPFFIAGGMGGLSRLATGGGSLLKDYGLPLAIGGGTGVAAAHWPLGHEVLFQPAFNPEKEKYQAYARELPPTHPRKQEWTDYAKSQPDANPARTTAVEEFYNPARFAERSAIGLIEGLSGGKGGAQAVQAMSRLGGSAARGVGTAVEGAAELPGRAVQGYNKGMTGAENEKLLREFSNIKNQIAEARGFKADAEAAAALAAARERAARAAQMPAPAAPAIAAPAPIALPSSDTPAARAARYLNQR